MPSRSIEHRSVLTREVVSYLQPQTGQRYVDATVGSGGHAEALLTASSPDGRLLGLDCDAEALERSAHRLSPFGDRVVLRSGNFAQIAELAASAGFGAVSGVVMDLGFSSEQVNDPERGFSFRLEGPLDMRYDRTTGETAGSALVKLQERELADIIFQFGEERRSRRIARKIAERRRRPLSTSRELAELIEDAVGRHRGRIHPATRTFQALRIYINHELDNLSLGLEGALTILTAGGRLAVISFHSLEDRIVKSFIRDQEQAGKLHALTSKPVRPSVEERADNPRSRSAKLRAAEVLA